jgi:hypothetical protein
MDGEYLTDANPLFSEFEDSLRQLVEEIFDPQVDFVQTNREETCKLCPYKGICYR